MLYIFFQLLQMRISQDQVFVTDRNDEIHLRTVNACINSFSFTKMAMGRSAKNGNGL